MTNTYFDELKDSQFPIIGKDYYVYREPNVLSKATCLGWHWSFREDTGIRASFDGGLIVKVEDLLEIDEVEKDLLDFEMEDALFSDVEALLEANEARALMYQAQGEVHNKRVANQPSFDKAFGGFLGKKQESVGFQLDKRKVALTLATQSASVGVLASCIYLGVWPVALATVPLFLAVNYFQLRKSG